MACMQAVMLFSCESCPEPLFGLNSTAGLAYYISQLEDNIALGKRQEPSLPTTKDIQATHSSTSLSLVANYITYVRPTLDP